MSNLSVIIAKAESYQKEKDYRNALLFFEKAIAINSQIADLHCQKGICLFHLSRNNEALAAMDTAVLLQPDYSYRYASRAYIKASLKKYDEAILDYEKCISLDPEDAIAMNNLGLLQEQRGWHTKAESNFHKSNELLGILNKSGIDLPENNPEVKAKEKVNYASKWQIIKSTFSNKDNFREFVLFVKNRFKLKE